jgi:hypothetical protein
VNARERERLKEEILQWINENILEGNVSSASFRHRFSEPGAAHAIALEVDTVAEKLVTVLPAIAKLEETMLLHESEKEKLRRELEELEESVVHKERVQAMMSQHSRNR